MSRHYYDEQCLVLWRKCVRALWQDKCAICSITKEQCGFIGDRQILECHHGIPRSNWKFRHEPVNGILLCPLKHDWAETHPVEFEAFLREHWSATYDFIIANRFTTLDSPLWDIHLMERRTKLKETLEWLKEITAHPSP